MLSKVSLLRLCVEYCIFFIARTFSGSLYFICSVNCLINYEFIASRLTQHLIPFLFKKGILPFGGILWLMLIMRSDQVL